MTAVALSSLRPGEEATVVDLEPPTAVAGP